MESALAEDPFSGHVFVFRGPRRHDQTAVVDRRWPVLAGQAARARTLHLATGNQRHGNADPGAAIDAAGRDRLAPAGAHVEAKLGLVNVAALA